VTLCIGQQRLTALRDRSMLPICYCDPGNGLYAPILTCAGSLQIHCQCTVKKTNNQFSLTGWLGWRRRLETAMLVPQSRLLLRRRGILCRLARPLRLLSEGLHRLAHHVCRLLLAAPQLGQVWQADCPLDGGDFEEGGLEEGEDVAGCISPRGQTGGTHAMSVLCNSSPTFHAAAPAL
jgi:hypothetical protein